MKIGFHIPFSGNLVRLEERVNISRGNTFQIFARGLRGGKLQNLKPKQLSSFYEYIGKKGISPIIVHAPYSYNLMAEDAGDVELIIEDLDFAQKLGAQFYVLQVGSFKKMDRELAKLNIKDNLAKILDKTSWTGKILIKNSSGAGSQACSTLEEWTEIVYCHERLGAALDLSRMYSSGHDFQSIEEMEMFMKKIQLTVSWHKIEVLYINDNDRFCGCKKDRFETPLGHGVIGYNGFQTLLMQEEVKEKTWIVENVFPKTEEDDYLLLDGSIKFLTTIHQKGGEVN